MKKFGKFLYYRDGIANPPIEVYARQLTEVDCDDLERSGKLLGYQFGVSWLYMSDEDILDIEPFDWVYVEYIHEEARYRLFNVSGTMRCINSEKKESDYDNKKEDSSLDRFELNIPEKPGDNEYKQIIEGLNAVIVKHFDKLHIGAEKAIALEPDNKLGIFIPHYGIIKIRETYLHSTHVIKFGKIDSSKILENSAIFNREQLKDLIDDLNTLFSFYGKNIKSPFAILVTEDGIK